MMDPLFSAVIAVSLGSLFLLSAIAKTLRFSGFRETLDHYRLAPPTLLAPGALAIIALEYGAAIGIALAATRSVGLVVAGSLLLLYALGMGINVARGRRHIDCGCLGFGAARPYLGWPLVARNLVLAAFAFAASAPAVIERSLSHYDWVTLGGAPIAFALIYLGFGLWLALPRGREGAA